jgi:hypothetical protein
MRYFAAGYSVSDGKIIDDISHAELTSGMELPALQAILFDTSHSG